MSPVSKFTAVLLSLLITIFVIFSLPIAVSGQGFDATPSQVSETDVQTTSTATPGSTDTLTPTNTLVAQHQITNTVTVIFFASLSPSPSSTGTMTPTPKTTVMPIASASPVETEDLPSDRYVEDEVLVKIKTHEPSQTFLSDLKSLDAEIKTELPGLDVLVIKVPVGSVPDFIATIKLSSSVVYAEPNYLMSITDTIPNDSGWGFQYGPAAIHAPQGWDLSTGSSAVTIAVIDTGIDQSHPDLAAKIVPGYDFANNDSDPQDDNGHGTHVAGIAAASANNGLGIAGISWGARLMPVKVLNAAGNGSYANAALGIIWAADNGAQVINLSFGGSTPSATLQAAVIYAYNKGVTIVAAAGNSGANFLLYPARYPEVIAVAATDSSNVHAGFSNYGPEMSVSAPGVSIYSSLPGGSYGYLSGTSMSAPMVSGAAAVLAGLPGNNNPAAITWELQTSALDLGTPGFDALYGYGLIQLDAAIRLALPITPTPTLTATPTLTPTVTTTASPSETLQAKPTWTVTSTLTPAVSASPSSTPTAARVASATAHSWFIFSPIPFFSTAAPSITPTWTATITPTFTGSVVAPADAPTPTGTMLEGSMGDIQVQGKPPDDSLWLPCLGVLFILAGLGLARVTIMLQRKP